MSLTARALLPALLLAACAAEPPAGDAASADGTAPVEAQASMVPTAVAGELAAAEAADETAEEIEGFLSISNQRMVQLFFPSKDDDRLVPEERIIFLTGTLTSQVKQAVSELLLGPQDEDNRALGAFPTRTRLLAIFLLDEGTAMINLGREARAIPPGSASELSSVYALVNTVVFNFAGIERVRILIEGKEATTLAGHVDLAHAIGADLQWVNWGLDGPPLESSGAAAPWDVWSSEMPLATAEEENSPSPRRGRRLGPI